MLSKNLNLSFIYSFRDQLKQHYNLGECYLEVDLNDLSSYDELLADKLIKSPSEYIPLVRKAHYLVLNWVFFSNLIQLL